MSLDFYKNFLNNFFIAMRKVLTHKPNFSKHFFKHSIQQYQDLSLVLKKNVSIRFIQKLNLNYNTIL